jgi:uncharacterized membrane protein SirB2
MVCFWFLLQILYKWKNNIGRTNRWWRICPHW